MKTKYDVVIIGGGLGGLSCGAILSKEGMSVCILEQHRIIGGCFQSFKRGRYTMDTGIHFVGSMEEGQTMRQYFRYFGVEDKLNMRRLEQDGFEEIRFGDGKSYRYALGYENFYETLAQEFPEDRKGIAEYCALIRKIGSSISPDVLRTGLVSSGGIEYTGMPIYDEIARLVKNPRLRDILAAEHVLYAGHPEKSSIYEHAMINHSNIEGAYSFVGDTQHVADAFVEAIEKNGGEVHTSCKVTKIHLNGNVAEYVELENGERIEADYIISAVHPSQTLSLLENNSVIKKAYFTRVNSLENTYGIFTAYLLMKPESYKHINRNFYLYDRDNIWSAHRDCMNDEVNAVFVCMQDNGKNEYTDVITVLAPMLKSQVEKWEDTYIGHRGEDYKEFKAVQTEKMMKILDKYFPDIRPNIQDINTASPLTYRDYTLTPDGTAYGIVKDYHNPIVNHLPTRTKISNLPITGQNLNVHGCIGVSVSAAVTCSELLGEKYLAEKIGNA